MMPALIDVMLTVNCLQPKGAFSALDCSGSVRVAALPVGAGWVPVKVRPQPFLVILNYDCTLPLVPCTRANWPIGEQAILRMPSEDEWMVM